MRITPNHIFHKTAILFAISILLLESGCSPARRVAEGSYLLGLSKIEVDSRELEKSEIQRYDRQKENKKILGLKFHLFLYNLASPDKEKGISKWLREIGEEPVIWDSMLTKASVEQFGDYLESRGFYDASVSDTIILHNKRAKITYHLTLNTPHRINSINYMFEDPSLTELVFDDTINRRVKVGNRFDKEIIQNERQRLEDLMKNNGYYKFTKEFIFFEAKQTAQPRMLDLKIIFKENITGAIDPETKVRKHYQYKIQNTFIYPDYNLISSLENPLPSLIDTVYYKSNNIIYYGKHKIRPVTVSAPNILIPGSLYRMYEVKKTYTNYSSLGLFRLVNIRFKENGSDGSDTSAFKPIECIVELSPRTIQSYQIEVVGTNSSGEYGVRSNLSYNNYNLFHGAEYFRVLLTGAIESIANQDGVGIQSREPMREYGVETTLALPVFLVPFNAERFIQKYNPKTLFGVSYNYQNQPNRYVRTIVNTTFGYQWKGNTFNRHVLNPIEFSYVRLPKGLSESLQNEIEGTARQASFIEHTILASSYQFEYTNQIIEKRQDFIFFRFKLESAGLLLNTLSNLSAGIPDTTFLNSPYFQYVKTDVDFRYSNQITKNNRVVYRLFAGYGRPYNVSSSMPFEKMYFAGGPNGIRAWQTGTLGPGSDTTSYAYGNRLGDIKLEGNIEYRFFLFWKMEGALFVDAGNIWTMKSYDDRPGAVFQWNTFYKDMAVGTGLGLRFDFSFLLLRTDFGYKLRDPAIVEGSKWISWNFNKDNLFIDRWSFHLGIGYPF